MEFEILGSGGAFVTPRPGYHDAMNDEARAKGVPYQRRGPSVFLHEHNVLFDTPEDIVESLNRAGIDDIQAVFYSHYHPDHTMGRRLFEQTNWDLTRIDAQNKVTDVYVTERVRKDMQKVLGAWKHLEYLQSLGIVKVHVVPVGEPVEIGSIKITPLPIAVDYVFAFLVEDGDARAWVCMDELHGWSPDATVADLDLAILPSGVSAVHPLTGEPMVEAGHPVLETEMLLERTIECVREMQPKQAVLIHLDAVDGISYDDGLRLSKRYQAEGLPITFAYDGLRIAV